jgi:hypothetical protein
VAKRSARRPLQGDVICHTRQFLNCTVSWITMLLLLNLCVGTWTTFRYAPLVSCFDGSVGVGFIKYQCTAPEQNDTRGVRLPHLMPSTTSVRWEQTVLSYLLIVRTSAQTRCRSDLVGCMIRSRRKVLVRGHGTELALQRHGRPRSCASDPHLRCHSKSQVAEGKSYPWL